MGQIHLKRPEYYFQPSRIFSRLFQTTDPHAGFRTPWGISIEVSDRDEIGKSIAQTGVYDVAVTELLFRLIEKGDIVADVGANIGYMTGICSLLAGESGIVYAFEPNPMLQERLKKNLEQTGMSNVLLFAVGLSDSLQPAKLVIPSHYSNNEGVAFVGDSSSGQSFDISLERLDNIVPSNTSISVMKIDVEGHELQAFKGSERLLKEARIKNIIFEDHHNYPSDVVWYLESFGYSIFRIEKGWMRVNLKDPFSRSTIQSFEPTNYLATVQPDFVNRKMRNIGYQCFGRGLGRCR